MERCVTGLRCACIPGNWINRAWSHADYNVVKYNDYKTVMLLNDVSYMC